MTHLRPLLLLALLAVLASSARSAPADPASYLAPVIGELGREYPRNRTVNLVFHGHSVPAGYSCTAEALLRNADSALYAAKRAGRNRVEVGRLA